MREAKLFRYFANLGQAILNVGSALLGKKGVDCYDDWGQHDSAYCYDSSYCSQAEIDALHAVLHRDTIYGLNTCHNKHDVNPSGCDKFWCMHSVPIIADALAQRGLLKPVIDIAKQVNDIERSGLKIVTGISTSVEGTSVETRPSYAIPKTHAATIAEYIANVLEYIGGEGCVIAEPDNLENALWWLACPEKGAVHEKLRAELQAEMEWREQTQ